MRRRKMVTVQVMRENQVTHHSQHPVQILNENTSLFNQSRSKTKENCLKRLWFLILMMLRGNMDQIKQTLGHLQVRRWFITWKQQRRGELSETFMWKAHEWWTLEFLTTVEVGDSWVLTRKEVWKDDQSSQMFRGKEIWCQRTISIRLRHEWMILRITTLRFNNLDSKLIIHRPHRWIELTPNLAVIIRTPEKYQATHKNELNHDALRLRKWIILMILTTVVCLQQDLWEIRSKTTYEMNSLVQESLFIILTIRLQREARLLLWKTLYQAH